MASEVPARQHKAALRKRILDSVSQLSANEIAVQSKVTASRATALQEYRDAKSLSVFLSMPGREVSTRAIVLQALSDGKKVFVPFIHSVPGTKSKVMDMLRLKDERDLDSLKPDPWGIPSLSAESVPQRENALGGIGCFDDVEGTPGACPGLDLIFVPAVAFDLHRHRLGHGRGFYDRYLSRYKEISSSQNRPFPYLAGVALREQILPVGEVIPVVDHDWQVDKVITAHS